MNRIPRLVVCVAVCGVFFLPGEMQAQGASPPEEASAPPLTSEFLSQVVTASKEPDVGSVDQRVHLADTIALLNNGDLASAQQAWTDCTVNIAETDVPTDVNSFILHILNQSYLQSSPDLLMHAEKVRFFQAQAEAVRAHIAGLRKQETAYTPDETKETTIQEVEIAEFVPGGAVVHTAAAETVARDGLAARITEWERALDLVVDDGRLAREALKESMVAEAEALQDMAQAAKMLHDVAKASR